jgi:hypothetical protein
MDEGSHEERGKWCGQNPESMVATGEVQHDVNTHHSTDYDNQYQNQDPPGVLSRRTLIHGDSLLETVCFQVLQLYGRSLLVRCHCPQ